MRATDLSLGWRSHLLANGFGAEIVERDDYIVLRTPGNPTFYWGNCLILPAAPRDADLAHWLRRFDDEITRQQPESQHLAFGVQAEVLDHELPSWHAAGIDEHDETTVLTLQRDTLMATPAVRGIPHVELRALDLSKEASLAVEAQVATRDASFEEEGYRVFRDRAMQRMAAMQATGIAQWFGALVDDQLVADCGLVHDRTMGRFQNVQTQAAWRRRGLCRALVHHVSRHAFDLLGLQQLVICADPHDVAIGIYRSVGFAQAQTHWCLQRRPLRDRG